MIAARRPGAPLVARAPAAMSAAPKSVRPARLEPAARAAEPEPQPAQRRTARIVQVTQTSADDREKLRLRLLDRLAGSETRGAITRSADELVREGFELPAEQPLQLQLLDHFDEERARAAIEVLSTLIAKEPAFKRPIMDQRLRRLEEYAEDPSVRDAAAELRRAIRG
ncbi:MAG: hypothetical protein HYZ29_06530 [Myxococcales bacterium]|nr:hypothetical protein [Myxococcales bacterium]